MALRTAPSSLVLYSEGVCGRILNQNGVNRLTQLQNTEQYAQILVKLDEIIVKYKQTASNNLYITKSR